MTFCFVGLVAVVMRPGAGPFWLLRNDLRSLARIGRVLAPPFRRSTFLRLALAASLGTAGLLDNLVEVRGAPAFLRYPARFVLEAGALGLLWWHCLLWAAKGRLDVRESAAREAWQNSFQLAAYSADDLKERTNALWGSTSQEVLTGFVERLTGLAIHRTRVVEDIHIEDDHIMRLVRCQYRVLPEDAQGVLLVPYAAPDKGAIFEGLVVRDQAGQDLNTLSYGDTVALLIRCFVLLRDDLLPALPEVGRLELATFSSLAEAGLISGEKAEAWLGQLAEVERLTFDPALRRQLEQFRTFSELCFYRRPLVAQLTHTSPPVPLPTDVVELLFQYSEQKVASDRDVPIVAGWPRFKRWVRRVASASPNELLIDVSRTRSAASFEARVRPPRGYYVYDSALWDRKSKRLAPENLQHGQRYTQFASWDTYRGRPSANLHTNGLATSEMERPVFVVKVNEVPPGSMGRAFVAAFSTMVTVWICGVLFPTRQRARQASTSSPSSSRCRACWVPISPRPAAARIGRFRA